MLQVHVEFVQWVPELSGMLTSHLVMWATAG